MEDIEVAHLAGLFDGVGTVTVHIGRDANYAIGYRVQPLVYITQHEDHTAMLGKLDAFAEDYHIHHTMVEMSGPTIRFELSKPRSIERFLKKLLPYVVTQTEPSWLMLDEILPMIREDRHKTEDGVYKIAGVADKLRDSPHGGADPTYTQKYFKEKEGWD